MPAPLFPPSPYPPTAFPSLLPRLLSSRPAFHRRCLPPVSVFSRQSLRPVPQPVKEDPAPVSLRPIVLRIESDPALATSCRRFPVRQKQTQKTPRLTHEAKEGYGTACVPVFPSAGPSVDRGRML